MVDLDTVGLFDKDYISTSSFGHTSKLTRISEKLQNFIRQNLNYFICMIRISTICELARDLLKQFCTFL